MAELGVDRTHALPKKLTTDAIHAADVVITMGCGDCPTFPDKRYLDWDVPDPAGKTSDQVRPIRDDIDAHVWSCWRISPVGLPPRSAAVPCGSLHRHPVYRDGGHVARFVVRSGVGVRWPGYRRSIWSLSRSARRQALGGIGLDHRSVAAGVAPRWLSLVW